MALITCPECKGSVSDTLDCCPHCGYKIKIVQMDGENKKDSYRLIVTAIIILIIIFSLISFCSSPSPSPSPKTETPDSSSTSPEEQATKALIGASVYCKNDIEKASKFDVKWVDDLFSFKFSKYVWLDQDKGIIAAFGDKARFQNIYGAYENIDYRCDFDSINNKVLKVYVPAEPVRKSEIVKPLAQNINAEAPSTQESIQELDKYVGQHPRKILKEPAIASKFRPLLLSAKNYNIFRSRLSVSSGVELKNDFYVGTGCLPHACGSDEAAFAINRKTGEAYAVMIVDGKQITWYGVKDAQTLPTPLLEWFNEHNGLSVGAVEENSKHE